MNLRLLALRSLRNLASPSSVERFRVRRMVCTTVTSPYSTGVDVETSAKVAPSPWQRRKIFQKLRFLTVETIDLIIGAEEKKGLSVAQADLFSWAKRLKNESTLENTLEIFLWMDKEKMVFSPKELAMYVDLMAKVKGISAAHNMFERFDPNFTHDDHNSEYWPAYMTLVERKEEFYENSNMRRFVFHGNEPQSKRM